MTKVYCNRNCVNYKCERHKVHHIITEEKVFYHIFDDCDKYKSFKAPTRKTYSIGQLRYYTGVSETCIKMYLCRAEFSHVKKVRHKNVYENIFKSDLERLRKLGGKSKCNQGK